MTVRWSGTVKKIKIEWDDEFADSKLQMNVAFCHYLLQKGNGKYRMSEIFDFHLVFSV